MVKIGDTVRLSNRRAQLLRTLGAIVVPEDRMGVVENIRIRKDGSIVYTLRLSTNREVTASGDEIDPMTNIEQNPKDRMTAIAARLARGLP